MIARATVSGCLAGALLGLVTLSQTGCNPYDRHTGNYIAGSVDPEAFPAAYLGAGGKGNMPGMGTFTPVQAVVGGKTIFYYSFPLPPAQANAMDPLDLSALGPSGSGPALAYVFDPGPTSPIGQLAKCVPPANYKYDPQHDMVDYSKQGNIFTDLPGCVEGSTNKGVACTFIPVERPDTGPGDDPSYVPIVAEVPVTSSGEPCQDLKSEEEVLAATDVKVPENPAPQGVPMAMPSGKPDGKYLAWAIIDPAATVVDPYHPNDMSGVTAQQWGWFKQYLLAYLDGGYIPTTSMMGQDEAVTQKLYYPANVVMTDPMTMKPMTVAGKPGAGNDTLEAARNGTGYSPLCHVFSYDMKDAMGNPLIVSDATMIDQATVMDTGTLIYCLQIQ